MIEPTTNSAMLQLAEHALPCLKGDIDEAKDCMYWLLGKCKHVNRTSSREKVLKEPEKFYSDCIGHRSRQRRGLGKAIGA